MNLWSQISSVFIRSSERVWLKQLFMVSICTALKINKLQGLNSGHLKSVCVCVYVGVGGGGPYYILFDSCLACPNLRVQIKHDQANPGYL